MRVTTSTSYRNLLSNLERISERMANTQNSISSGRKLHKPSDDPTAVADVVRIQAEQSQTLQYLDNLASGTSRLQAAEGTLQSVVDKVAAIRDLALSSRSSADAAKQNADLVSSYRDDLLRNANQVADGQFIFAGSNVDTTPYVTDSAGNVSYTGDAEAVQLQTGPDSLLQVQVPGSEIFSGSVDVFVVLKDLKTAMTNADNSGISAQVTKLEQFYSTANKALAKVGSLDKLAQSRESELKQTQFRQTAERSKREDTDMAAALTEYTLSETALRAATAAGARISNITILDYL